MLSKDVLIFITYTTVVGFVLGSPLTTNETTIWRRPQTTLTYDASTTSRPKTNTFRSTIPAWQESTNPPNTTFEWVVSIVTAKQKNADTDANVYIQIFGDTGSSPILHLDNSGNNDFERGEKDYFRVDIDEDLGTPTSIRVWRDDAGHSPDWKVEWIGLTVTPIYGGIGRIGLTSDYTFMCGCWIDGENSGGTELRPADSWWRITIVTSDVTAAGTDDDVTIVLHGERGQSRPLTLDSPKDDFQRGSTQGFTKYTFDIGTPTFISVTAGKDGDGWRLDKIVLENTHGARRYTFECHCWFDSDSYPRETTRNIYGIETFTVDPIIPTQ